MKYVILAQSNPRSLAVWETLTDQQRTDLGLGHLRLTVQMREAGVLVATAVRAHLEMAGSRDEAREQYRQAARLTLSGPEQRYLESRAARLRAGMFPLVEGQ
ncbi:hypothetical protein ACQP2E_21040 [Actinoplanes sp. CA-015351]|uniref:hypothetical protein n=1 Tax=Actinoplanes sp. CA-015351 TaxID=3239897 RepID=UPI003D960EBD